jgi:hypothetical protein
MHTLNTGSKLISEDSVICKTHDTQLQNLQLNKQERLATSSLSVSSMQKNWPITIIIRKKCNEKLQSSNNITATASDVQCASVITVTVNSLQVIGERQFDLNGNDLLQIRQQKKDAAGVDTKSKEPGDCDLRSRN